MSAILSIEISRQTATVSLDDGHRLICRKNDPAALGLHEGDECAYEALRGKLCRLQLDEGYEAALTLLDYSARTEHEIRKKLALKGYLDEVIDAVAERLKSVRLIDDALIAERLVQAAQSSGKGRFAVRQKLRMRGICEDDSEEALFELDSEQQSEAAFRAAQSLIRKYAAFEPRIRKQKLSQALARRGFAWDSIEAAISKLTSCED